MDSFAVNPAVVTVTDAPAHDFVCVHISGDVDLTAEGALTAAMRELAAIRRPSVYVDLADVGFGGTTLMTFLVRVIKGMPAPTPVMLCRPGRMTRYLIEMFSLDTIATVCDDLPTGARVR